VARPKSPEEMSAAIMRNLTASSGKTQEEWTAIGATVPPGRFTERVKWLQDEYGLGRGQAQAVLWFGEHSGTGATPPTYEELVARQYAGKKAALRPILDAVVTAAGAFGGDVEAGARETYVSLDRRRQFAIVRAATQTAVAVGLVLPDVPASPRLEPPGSLGSDRITCKVVLRSSDELDEEALGWLRAAYEADAG
jgi:Domain of unknown function (DUF5655)/Domain of unknown function (DUF4287)